MVGAPKHVRGCTIRNDASGDVAVVVHFEKNENEDANSNDHIQSTTVSQGNSHRVESRSIDVGSYQISPPIVTVQATLPSGQKHEVKAPFEGVRSVEGNWLFVINNEGIQSVSSAE